MNQTPEKDKKEKKDRQPLPKILRNNLFMIRFVAKYTPSYLFWMIVEGVIWGLIHSFSSVVFTKLLFDTIDGEHASFKEAAVILVVMTVFSLLTYIFHVWYWHLYHPKTRQILHKKMQMALFEKARSLDLSCYDDPTFYNDFVWAINESDTRAAGIVDDIGKLINRIVSICTIIGVLLAIDPIVVIVLLTCVTASMSINVLHKKITFRRRTELLPHNRKDDYVTRVYALPEYAAQLRLGSAPDLLEDTYDKTLDSKIKIMLRYGRKLFGISALWSFLDSFLCEGSINIFLAYRLYQGSIKLGDFAAGTNAIWQLWWSIRSFIDYLVKFPEHSLYADKFRTFMEYQPKVTGGEREVDTVDEIVFENVSFSYPSTENDSLKNVSLRIQKGEKIAIVGYNGAGKTTLIKLLLHLYNPTSGRILLNGNDLSDYDIASYHRKCGVIFQDHCVFAASIAENVAADLFDEGRTEAVLSALEQAGFTDKLHTLEDGIQTHLTREFSESGVNLSGGEVQKIALSRVFYQDASLIVMDEPSSALDPMAEYRLNQTILDYAEDKTVIFISHRLSTTRMADRIYMFDSGALIESGSHDQLMERNGKYAEMFNLQAEKYREEQ